MRKFVRQGKHLCRFRIRPVNEYERREIVRQREPTKLLGIQTTMGVVHDNSAAHYQDAEAVRLADKQTKGIGPSGVCPAALEIERKRPGASRQRPRQSNPEGSETRRMQDGRRLQFGRCRETNPVAPDRRKSCLADWDSPEDRLSRPRVRCAVS